MAEDFSSFQAIELQKTDGFERLSFPYSFYGLVREYVLNRLQTPMVCHDGLIEFVIGGYPQVWTNPRNVGSMLDLPCRNSA